MAGGLDGDQPGGVGGKGKVHQAFALPEGRRDVYGELPLRARQVPDPDLEVEARGRQLAVYGVEGNCRHGIGVAPQDVAGLSAAHVPHP